MGFLSSSFSKLFRTATITALSILISAPFSFALADAATHSLSIKTIEYDKVDCGGGTCSSECAVVGKLKMTRFGPEKSAPIEVQIWYKTNHVDSGESSITLTFDELSKGKVAEARGQAPGYKCRQVVVKRIAVECPLATNDRCPGFYYVQIPDMPLLKIKAQKIEGK